MSVEPNSVRLQRLTKTMDLYSNRSTSMIQNTSTESVKLPVLRAINKGIKYNDLSFATSRDLSKLRKEPDQIDNIEEVSAHHSLMLIRKRYDNMSKNRQEKQKEVDKLQLEHDKLSTQQNNFENDKKDGKGKVNDLGGALQQMKLQLEEAEIEKKIMLNMVDRLKTDKVTYDLRRFNMEKGLTQTQKLRKLIEEENKKQRQVDDKTEKLRGKLIAHINNEKKQRDDHLGVVSDILNEKEGMVNNQSIRGEQMKEIALLTLQDKDFKQKSWYKCYLCHRFVEKLLRDKMHREMMKFNVVEVAFKNIKTATGINNAELLIKKYLNKENTYGDLLGKIADNERTIAHIKNQAEQLRKETRELESQQEHLNSTSILTKDLSKEEKEFDKITKKSMNCLNYEQNLKSWTARNLKKFDQEPSIPEGSEQQSLMDKNYPLLIANFKAYLVSLVSKLQELQSLQVDDSQLGSLDNKANWRIKISDNSHDREEKPHLQVQQGDFIERQRQNLLRSNEKFMKELHKKYEDIKKAMIEAEPKKKEVVAPVPKPVPKQD